MGHPVIILGNTWPTTEPHCIRYFALQFNYLQNGRFTNINYIDENLSALEVLTEFLLKVSLTTCGHVPVEEQVQDCTAPGALVTDFNIWDSSMSDIELIHWTSCQ